MRGGNTVGPTSFVLLPRVRGAKRVYVGSTTRDGPEDLTRISGISKAGSQFLINTRLLPQFSHSYISSTEDDVSDVDTGDTEAEDIW